MKRVVLCLSALMVMGLFTGCGGNDKKVESGSSTSTTATTTTAAATSTEAATTTTETTTHIETSTSQKEDGGLVSDLGDAGRDVISDTESIISNAGERMR